MPAKTPKTPRPPKLPQLPKLPTPKAGSIGATARRLGDTHQSVAARVASRLRRGS